MLWKIIKSTLETQDSTTGIVLFPLTVKQMTYCILTLYLLELFMFWFWLFKFTSHVSRERLTTSDLFVGTYGVHGFLKTKCGMLRKNI